MRCAPRALNGPDHLGLCTPQVAALHAVAGAPCAPWLPAGLFGQAGAAGSGARPKPSNSGHRLLWPPADWCPVCALPGRAGSGGGGGGAAAALLESGDHLGLLSLVGQVRAPPSWLKTPPLPCVLHCVAKDSAFAVYAPCVAEGLCRLCLRRVCARLTGTALCPRRRAGHAAPDSGGLPGDRPARPAAGQRAGLAGHLLRRLRAGVRELTVGDDCHFADTPSTSILKHLIKVEGSPAK